VKYQHDYSQHFPAVADPRTRARKAVKIRQVVEDFLGHDLTGLTCLDLGCSIGIITEELARWARLAGGLDIDGPALRYAADQPGALAAFLLGDGGATPFADATFDVIVCSQVYEHSPDVPALVSEIYRLLKDDGVCFFSGPNRWAVIERHYNLPFLSWLPRSLADRYVRLAGRAEEYYEHPLSAGELHHILHRFEVHDYSAKLMSEPSRFAMEEETGRLSWVMSKAPAWAWRIVGGWVPNFNWILTKHV
jgi:SAM-dependent methyltransferase